MSVRLESTRHQKHDRRAPLGIGAGMLWHVPGCFGIARLLGPSYSLRCVVFHNISTSESPFTRGMGVTITPGDFEAALRFLTEHYTPVRLDEVLADSGKNLPRRAVLVTFDDAYASSFDTAAPLCLKFGVPAIFFASAAFLDNQRLALDNLVCYVANTFGMESVNAAAQATRRAGLPKLTSLVDVFTSFFPIISLSERESFRESLVCSGKIREQQLAQEAGLYMSSKQLRYLGARNFEIGNHTYNHVNCRCLSKQTFTHEIDKNKSALEALSGKLVQSFSVPYGASADLDCDLVHHLKASGHKAVFLSESCANPRGADLFRLDRVSIKIASDADFFAEIEVLPRLRTVRNWLFYSSGEASYRSGRNNGLH